MFKNGKILFTVAAAGLFVSMNAVGGPTQVTVAPGFYVGGSVGYGNTHQTGFPRSELDPLAEIVQPVVRTSSLSTGNALAARLFGGYQITPFFALEMGFTKFSNANVTTTALGSNAGQAVGTTDNAVLSAPVKVFAIDLVGKLMLPLGYEGIYIFGTLGGAYLNESANVSRQVISDDTIITFTPYSTTTAKVLPTFGAGFSYVFYSQVTGDISWSRIQNVGNNQNLTNTDYWGAGLTYHWG